MNGMYIHLTAVQLKYIITLACRLVGRNVKQGIFRDLVVAESSKSDVRQ